MTRLKMNDSNEAQSLIAVTLTDKKFPVQNYKSNSDALKDTYLTIQPGRDRS